MKKIMLVIMLASASVSLLAMENPLFDAVQGNNVYEARQLIAAGADVNTFIEDRGITINPLMAAIRIGNPILIQLLLDSGAQVDLQNPTNGADAILWAATTVILNMNIATAVAMQVLTHIPLSEQGNIRNTVTALGVIKRQPGIYLDARKLITNAMITELVNQQMNRIARLLGRKYQDLTARDRAIFIAGKVNNRELLMAKMLDLTNPQSVRAIRAAVEKNIRRILFAPQEKANH